MPIFEYRCVHCGFAVDVIQHYDSPIRPLCPVVENSCWNTPMVRQPSAPRLIITLDSATIQHGRSREGFRVMTIDKRPRKERS